MTKSVARLGTVFSLFLLVQSGLTVLSGVSQATYSDHQVLFKYLFAACEIGVVWATMIFIWWQSSVTPDLCAAGLISEMFCLSIQTHDPQGERISCVIP